jgi:outer membrane biosynthesis protein TonB
MSQGVKFSLILHALLILLMIFGLPHLFKPEPPKEMAISVELLPIKDISNVKTKKKPIEEKKDDTPDEAKTIVKASNVMPEEPKPEKKDLPKKEEQPQPTPNKKEEKKEEIKEAKKEEKKKEEKKKDEPKKEEKKKEKKQNFDPDALLKSLEDSADKKTDKATKNKTQAKKEEESKEEAKGTFDPNMELSISEEDFIKQQIYKYWNYPAGAKDAGKLTVLLLIDINTDGTVTNVEIIGGEKGDNPVVYQAVMDSAVRAVKRASPLKNLPTDKYSNWKHLELLFNPQDIMN